MFRHLLAVFLRHVRGAPLTSAVNLLTLAAGLVCFVAAFAFVTFWGAAERHFPKAGDVYVLTATFGSRDAPAGLTHRISVPDVAAELLATDYPEIDKVARAVVIDRQTMVASGGRAERMFGVAVDPEFLEMFDLPFVAGDPRTALASPRSAVITHEYALRLFGSDEPIGKSLIIGNSVDATVTGVIEAIPEPSHLGRSGNVLPFDLLASRDVLDVLRANPGGRRLPPEAQWFAFGTIVYLYLPASGGLSAGALAAQLDAFTARHVPADLKYGFDLTPVRSLMSGVDDFYDTGLSFATVLLLLGGLVLVVACVNYANLATARAARRVREIGVRKALGASPAQIAAHSLYDAGAFALAALVIALVAFVAAQPFVKRMLGAEIGSTFFTTSSAWPALAALVVVVAVAAGAYPAFVLSRVRPMSALGLGATRLGSPLFSTLLVGTQFAVASFLLIAVTVIAMQNAAIRRLALGSIEDPLVVIENPLRQTQVAAATLRERLANVPQVRAVTELATAPWDGGIGADVATSADLASPSRSVELRPVGFDFFDVFNVPLIAGRAFDRAHAEDLPAAARAPGVPPASAPANVESPPATNAVVDVALVAALGLGAPEEAVGKLLYRPANSPGPPQPPLRVVGVVGERALSSAALPIGGAIYTLRPELPVTVARVAPADVGAAIEGIDAAWHELAPNVAVSRHFLDEVFERAYSQYLRIDRLFTALAVMAFGICVAGLLGMATFVAGRRRREIGVRKTLGASTPRMVVLLLAGFSRPVLLANVFAWPAGYLAARIYLNQFLDPIALTPWPFVSSAGITLAIAAFAVLGQTLRAARTTPAEVLRQL
ncbi:MAG TPA: ABC transporter permease [Gammaproteobacteria bacterium]|nr:ABC transporter permease [Gammaproteobacteria bacterium]